jgi:hypothetical protein
VDALFTANGTGTSVGLNVGAGKTLAVAGTLTSTGTSSFSANPTFSGGTANGVAYLNGSKVLTTGSALTFNGTALGVTATLNINSSNNIQLNGGSGKLYFGDSTSNYYPYITSPSADTIGFNLNSGSEQMRLTSTGLGIGTSSPAYKLDVNGNAQIGNATAATNRALIINGVVSKASRIAFQESGTDRWLIGNGAASENGNFEIYDATNGNNLVMTRAGNLGLGVTPSVNSIAKAFELQSGFNMFGYVNLGYINANAYYNGGWLYKNTDVAGRYEVGGTHKWYNAPSGTAGNTISFTQAMTLDSSGNLLVGTTSSSPNPGLFVSPLGYMTLGNNAQASGFAFVSFDRSGTNIGSITQAGTTGVLYNLTSDQRLKENIQDAAPASALIDAIQVRQYDWKSDGSHQRYGFVAQELVTVAPEAVHQPADPEEMMAVDYSKLVPMLVKEIQSLRKRLADAGIA